MRARNKAIGSAFVVVIGLLLITTVLLSRFLNLSVQNQNKQSTKTSAELQKIQIHSKMDILRSKFLNELETWMRSWNGTSFDYDSEAVMFPYDLGDPNSTYSIHCYFEGATNDSRCVLEEVYYNNLDSNPPPASRGLLLPKIFEAVLFQSDPSSAIITKLKETWEVSALTLNDFALLVTNQDSSIQLGPANYGARVGINFNEDMGPFEVFLNNYSPINFAGAVVTSVGQANWIPMDPDGAAITYEKGISFEQGLDISSQEISSGFESLKNMNGTTLFVEEGAPDGDYSLQLGNAGQVQVFDGDGTLVYGPNVPNNETLYFEKPVIVQSPNNDTYSKTWTIVSEKNILIKSSMVASNPDESIALASTGGDVIIMPDAISLTNSGLLLEDIALDSDDVVHIRLDAALIAPRGQAIKVHSDLLDVGKKKIGVLKTNGMVITSNLPFYNYIDGVGSVHGFSQKTNTFNENFLKSDSSPPGLNIETKSLSIRVLNSVEESFSLDKVKSELGQQ